MRSEEMIRKEEARNVIATAIASLVKADQFSLDYGNHDIIGLVARKYREARNVAGSYVAIPRERPWTPGNPVKYETRYHTTVWWWPDEEKVGEVLIEFSIMDHEEGRYDDLLCSWENVTLSREEFISHVRETAAKMGVDVAWEDYETEG